jgi:hemerythrin
MLNELEWSEDYRLGLESIDEQHQHLFEIVGRIAALDSATSSKEDLKQILGDLSSYMHQHFNDEEAYMKRIRFPEFEYHRKLHAEIIEFVNTSITRSPTIAMIQTKLKFIIKKALIDHITLEDTKIKLYTAVTREKLADDCVIDL